jgi:hypothetical protein
VAIDLSHAARHTTAVSGSRVLDLTSPDRRRPSGVSTSAGSRSEVIDLTTPTRSPSRPDRSSAVDMRAANNRERASASSSAYSPVSASSAPRSYFPTSAGVDLTSPLFGSSATHRGPYPGYQPQAGRSGTGTGFRQPTTTSTTSSSSSVSNPQPHSQLGNTTTTVAQDTSSLQPSHCPHAMSANTPPAGQAVSRAQQSTDLAARDSASSDDLALTSPDRLTSDVRHYFQGDLP